MPRWRNWQTHQLQELAGSNSWRFKSSPGHFFSALLLAFLLLVTLRTDKTVYQLGEDVRIALTVTNRSRQDFTATFPSAWQADFAVYDRAGKAHWRWSAGRMFAQALTTLTLKPGESRTYQAIWEQLDQRGERVKAGKYSLKGALLYRSAVNSARQPLIIR